MMTMFATVSPVSASAVMGRRAAAIAGTLVLGLAATPALANSGLVMSGFAAGLSHPFLGLDHLLAMVAVGLWAATRKPSKAWQAPAVFMGCLTLGGILGIVTGPILMVEPLIAGSLLGFAVLLLAAPLVSDRVGLTMIGTFALVHGHAHGSEATGMVATFFAGFLIASATLHAIGWKLGTNVFASPLARWIAGLGIGGAGLALAFA